MGHFEVTTQDIAKAEREIGPDPGDNVIERLRHTVVVYKRDRSTSFGQFAVTATHNVYGLGKTTGLTYGDLDKLEAAIREDERAKVIEQLKRSGHIKS